LLTRRRVRPKASTLPWLSTTAPSTGLSQANFWAVAASIADAGDMADSLSGLGRSRGNAPGQILG
jgi:hypothetical protein